MAGATSEFEGGGLSENDLQCSCCYELMVEPTTLNCGHSFCRFCLAQWWHSSKHPTCPECRQPWAGFPKVNIVLRKAIETLFSREASERRHHQEESHDWRAVMSKFEALGKKSGRRSSRGSPVQLIQQHHVGLNFLKIIFIVLSILGIAMFAYEVLKLLMWQNDPLVKKSVIRWSTHDVAYWLGSLGDWAKGYDERFQSSGIDGKVLISLSESDLEMPPLNILIPYHRRTLIKEIELLRHTGVKPPSDLWEYKAAYPSRSVFLLWGLREFPRLTVVYMFLCCHQDVFQPLLYYTSEVQGNGNIAEATFPAMEYVRFILRLLLVPYYLIGKFTWRWFFLNYWVSGVILVYCALMTMVECSKLKWLLLGGWRLLPSVALKITSTAIMNGVFQLVLWHLMPTFVCDIAFYWMLCLGPLSAWNSFKACFADEEGEHNPTRAFLSWIWRKIKQQFQLLRAQRHF